MLVRLEKATERDLKVAKELLLDPNLKLKNIESNFRTIEEDIYAAKNMQNETLGCVYIKIQNSLTNRFAEISAIAVKKSDNETEVAKEILMEAEKIAVQKGCVMVQSVVPKGNKLIEKVLKAQKWKWGIYFYQNGETFYIHQKNLTGEESWLKLKKFSKSQ